ncbi:PAS domain-containing protein [Streptomyces sp. NPDC057682]|uniref:PAS domain-containing protein n=1 Tax=Streptomyces sp. NPDC057682 TaxID=3346210 RepID=UPI0036910386
MSSRPSRGAARLAAILDALPDGLLLVNCNGTVVNANTIALEMFETPGTALVGRGLLDLLPEFDSKLIPGSMRRPDAADERGRTKPTRMTARRTDGNEYPVEVTSASLEDGQAAYNDVQGAQGPYGGGGSYTGDELLMLVVRDLSGTVDTEAELARSQRQTEMILRAAAEGVVGTDTDGRVVLVNPAAAQILGFRASDLGGQELHPLILHSRAEGEPFPYEESPLADTLRSGRKHRVRGQVLWSKSGTQVPVDLTTAPVRDGDQLVGAVMTFTDRRPYEELDARHTAEVAELTAGHTAEIAELTEAHTAEVAALTEAHTTELADRTERHSAEREELTKRLTELSARHTQLTAVLGESLRGPLEELRGELSTLAADPAGQLWPEANQILHHLAAGYARMTTLIDNVLGYQRLDSGAETLVKTNVLLDGIVTAGIDAAVELIGPGRAQFAVHAPPIEAEVDPARLVTALAHLVADVAGVDSTGKTRLVPGGGYVDMTVVVAAAQRGDVVRIEVRGPFPGGDPVHVPIVSGIVRAHGGVLQTHEMPGMSGSAYVLEVPLGAGTGAVPPPAPADQPVVPQAPESEAHSGVPGDAPAPEPGRGRRRARRSSTDAFLESPLGGSDGTGEPGAAEPTGRRRARRAAAAGDENGGVPATDTGAAATVGPEGGVPSDTGPQNLPAPHGLVPAQQGQGSGRRRGRPSPAETGEQNVDGDRGQALALPAALPSSAPSAAPASSSEDTGAGPVPQAAGTGRPQLGPAAPPHGVPAQNVPPQGLPGQNVPPQGLPGDHMPAHGVPGRPTPPQPMPGRNTPAQHAPAQLSPSQSGASQSAPSQDSSDHGVPDLGQGVPAHAVPELGPVVPQQGAPAEAPVPVSAGMHRNAESRLALPAASHTSAGPQATGPQPVGPQATGPQLVGPQGLAGPQGPTGAPGRPPHAPAPSQAPRQDGAAPAHAPAPMDAAAQGNAAHAPHTPASPSGSAPQPTGRRARRALAAAQDRAAQAEAGPRVPFALPPADADRTPDAPEAADSPPGRHDAVTGAPDLDHTPPQAHPLPTGRRRARPAAAPHQDAPFALPVPGRPDGSFDASSDDAFDEAAQPLPATGSGGWDTDEPGDGPVPPVAGPTTHTTGTTPTGIPAETAETTETAGTAGTAGTTGPDAPRVRRLAPGPDARRQPLPAEAPMPGSDSTQGRAFSVRTLGQGVPFAQHLAHQQNQTLGGGSAGGAGRRRKLAAPPEDDRVALPPAAAPAPPSPPAPSAPQPAGPTAGGTVHGPGSGQLLAASSPEGRAYAIGAPDEDAAEGPEPLDGPGGAVEVANRPLPQPVDDELPPEPLDNPRRLLVWPAPDVSTQQALSDRGYRPVIVHSREEVDAQIAAFPAALFVDPLTGPITRKALQSLRQAAVAAEVPVLVTAGLGQASRDAAYGADPAVLLKALAPRDSEQHPPRVLLIEEHEDIAFALTQTLERRGMQVACAATDSEAVSLATRMRPNLVVMDLMQVRRRRAGIVDWLRANGRLNRTPLVVYTSADMNHAELAGLGSGESVLFLAERSTSDEVQSRIVDLLAKIGTN